MSQQNTSLSSPFGQYNLQRFPQTKQQKDKQNPLRAWDAADEYLLKHLAQTEWPEASRVLILNDSFGTLAVSLNRFHPVSQGDSYVGRCGTKWNLVENKLTESSIEFCSSLESPSGEFDLVVIKIPRSLALLEDQLYRLRPGLAENTIVIAGAMTRNIHRSTLKLFENILGPVTTSLAEKKSRLIFCNPDSSNWQGESPYPSSYSVDFEEQSYTFENQANVFSRDGLDAGTRLLLENLPANDQPINILDLGCGNGILGILAAALCPQANLAFIDESYMAIYSSKANFTQAFGETRKAVFKVNYQLDKREIGDLDLILNNPPFHHQNANDDKVAWQMFSDAKKALRKGGELRVVANRHLAYHVKLKRLFGNCRTVASNSKFVILASEKE